MADKKAGTENAAAALKVHHLRPAPGAKTAKTRVGRGEGSKGKTAGRGTKGTKARYQVPESFQGGTTPLHMRFPKLRGFKNPFKTTYQVVNLDKLSALYPKGGDVTIDDLARASFTLQCPGGSAHRVELKVHGAHQVWGVGHRSGLFGQSSRSSRTGAQAGCRAKAMGWTVPACGCHANS